MAHPPAPAYEDLAPHFQELVQRQMKQLEELKRLAEERAKAGLELEPAVPDSELEVPAVASSALHASGNPLRTAQLGPKYKTEFCRWHLHGGCQRGDACPYIHSEQEMLAMAERVLP
jgi:hypothetical protein